MRGGAQPLETVNDAEAQTLTYTVDTSDGHRGGNTVGSTNGHGTIGTAVGHAQTATTTSTTVTALAAGEESDQGDYTATELSPASSGRTAVPQERSSGRTGSRPRR
ncbi:hypothetical protein GCM10029992_25420 [Glycomyces albus]